ncbi:hypothetical protein SOVF_101480 isoform A [Spinacia oleracea]|nr:hypothetical protein SOVF_101480 isoform A [Spinacia oleracea]
MSESKRRNLPCSSWEYGESRDLFHSSAKGKCGTADGLYNGSGKLICESAPTQDGIEVLPDEPVSLKIAHCYSVLKKAASAIQFFYKGLQASEDDIDACLTLASLLLEENREEEAVELLSPPPNPVLSEDMHADRSEPWWLKVKVKLKLSHIYRTKGMLEAFVEVIYPIVHESLTIHSMHPKAKQRKKLSMNDLSERVKVLGENQTDSVLGLKANKAAKLLKKRATSKEKKISAAMAAGHDLESNDSGDEVPQQPLKEPPFPDLFKDEEHYNLISDVSLYILRGNTWKPDSPLTNLCVGTALVNLSLGHRLQNKHQCVAQGLTFLYNNLRLSEISLEALYNVARAYHHVGLVTLATTYYEKVLAIPQEDCPLPELMKDPTKGLKSGYCDLLREAAYNLHLIYERSGSVDLSRQMLRDYCTL